MNVTKLDGYERWAADKLRELVEAVEAEEVRAFALIIVRANDEPKIRLQRMAKAGEAHTLLGAVHEMAWDINREIAFPDEN